MPSTKFLYLHQNDILDTTSPPVRAYPAPNFPSGTREIEVKFESAQREGEGKGVTRGRRKYVRIGHGGRFTRRRRSHYAGEEAGDRGETKGGEGEDLSLGRRSQEEAIIDSGRKYFQKVRLGSG
ncbi:hypothetical protein B296_00013335 [Ensete ventricosum]|uniref:Uncharacterized protein n=1 Tax=Ensete ventricosum TaxID=4639 RepID=A0A426Y699_ENSVE|nr:hypothetical protein B296_00013335 [Ensete ventricosum]